MTTPLATADRAFSVSIQSADFDIRAEQAALTHARGDIGAVVTFTGLVRDFNERPGVQALTLEHYPGMTERSLQALLVEAQERFALTGARIIHRIGRLAPMDNIVLVLVASAHRQAAFAGCDFLMDNLKSRAPFWKKEHTASGDYWVQERSSDRDALERWHSSAEGVRTHSAKQDSLTPVTPQTLGDG
ncbi:molybdenum cofactor biosynthesis protein MoaE [Cobetia marina]|uniref:molybdenum cofactor biosynthesis protein MoaE n=1 Tax=Cobetia marina TaxID=28258 RepID=UPI00254950EB|nr:molybdenum cofactor biosynthesis protein MoaE [Cobetia pacifica]MDI6005129.1 molybdenum cofactor biosynthesis protein MoaE [Cobetia pacifica]